MKLKEFFKPTITKIILALALMFIPQYNQVSVELYRVLKKKISFLNILKQTISLSKNPIYFKEVISSLQTLVIWIILAYVISSIFVFLGNYLKKKFCYTKE